MFKFIKELFQEAREGYKEGLEEARAEIAQEEQQRQKELQQVEVQITAIPFNEKMALALAAPFRAVALEEYISLFAFDPETPKKLILKMYKSGVLQAKEKTDLKELMQRDFDITGEREAAIALLAFALPLTGNDFSDEDEKTALTIASFLHIFDDIADQDKKALCLCVSAYILTSCVEIGYIEKEEAMPVLKQLTEKCVSLFRDWEEYGTAFLAGEKAVELNNFVGRKILKGVVQQLVKDPGSPWNNVGFKDT